MLWEKFRTSFTFPSKSSVKGKAYFVALNVVFFFNAIFLVISSKTVSFIKEQTTLAIDISALHVAGSVCFYPVLGSGG